MMKIVTIIGARPQIIKAAALSRAIKNNFSALEVIVRLKDLKNCTEFYDIGVTTIIPQDYETGLQLGGAVLKSVGISEHEINRIKTQFRAGSYVVVKQDNTLLESEEDE